MASSVKIIYPKKIMGMLNKMKNTQAPTVKAGFFKDAKYPDGTSVADVAINNEFGTSGIDGKERIPPRPFMKQAFDKNQAKWLQYVNTMLEKQMKSGAIDYIEICTKLGLIMQGDIKDSIVTGDFKSNSPTTIAIKGKDTVLRDSNVMLQSVNNQVVTK